MEQPYNLNPGAPDGSMSPGRPLPKTWLVESIMVTLFFCLPFGIAGLINAAGVNRKYASGDYAGALAASAKAGKWTKIGFFVGISLGVLLFAMLQMGFFM